MLYVTQKDWYTKRDVLVLTCQTMQEVYDHFVAMFGKWSRFETYFDNDPLATYGVKRAPYGLEVPEHCFVITDNNDLRYSYEYVKGTFRKIRNPSGTGYYRYFYGGVKHHRSYYREVATFNERKHAVVVDEFEPKIRCKRNATNLPNSWDDILHEDVRNRNWKRYRKHQWK